MEIASRTEEQQALIDREHLRLLSIGYWVSAGTSAAMGLLGLVYMLLGVVIDRAFAEIPGAPGPRPGFGSIFGVLGGAWFALSALAALLKFEAGSLLRGAQARTYCLLIAALTCVGIPYGTVLGVFTFIVLRRPSVRRIFEESSGAAAAKRSVRRQLLVTAALALCAVLALVLTWRTARSLRNQIARAVPAAQAAPDFSVHFSQYQRWLPNKAMWVAFDDPKGGWSWSWRTGELTLGEAIRTARKECDEIRQKRGIAQPCRLYAINDEVVIDYTDAALQEALLRFRSMEETQTEGTTGAESTFRP